MDTIIHNDQLNSDDTDNSDNVWSDTATENFAAFILELRNIDLNDPLAALNATTISDNNGGRILL